MRQSGGVSATVFSLHTAALVVCLSLSESVCLSLSLSVCTHSLSAFLFLCPLLSLSLCQDGRVLLWIYDYCVSAADQLFTLSLHH